MFGTDFKNDSGKILLWGNMNITSPTNFVRIEKLRL